RMAKFVSFINAPGVADPELAWVPERGQMRPAGEMDTHTAPDPVRARELAMISMGATSPMGDSVEGEETDRKSTRLNSSHVSISYAVFCLNKNKSDRMG